MLLQADLRHRSTAQKAAKSATVWGQQHSAAISLLTSSGPQAHTTRSCAGARLKASMRVAGQAFSELLCADPICKCRIDTGPWGLPSIGLPSAMRPIHATLPAHPTVPEPALVSCQQEHLLAAMECRVKGRCNDTAPSIHHLDPYTPLATAQPCSLTVAGRQSGHPPFSSAATLSLQAGRGASPTRACAAINWPQEHGEAPHRMPCACFKRTTHPQASHAAC